jgi:HlyD family secretion protein
MAKENGAGLVKWIVIIAVVVVASAGIWRWKHQPEKAPEYKTAQVTRGDLTQLVTATGQLNPVTNVQVGSQVSGMIQKINVDFNSRVTNGQVIAQLDPSTYKAMVTQAQGDLANANAALELAKVEAGREKALLESKIVAQSDFDTANATLHQAEAQVMIKQAALDQAQVNLAYTTIYAPVDGVIISRSIDVGQTVAASFSAPILFMIANKLTQMQIDALVSEADVGNVESNQAVNFRVDAFPLRVFRGAVVQIRNAAQTNQNVITYDTVISVDNSDLKLRPGMTANVSIVTAQTNNTLKIPNSALRFRPPEATNNAAQADKENGKEHGEGGGHSGEGKGDDKGGHAQGERLTRTVYIPVKGADGKIESVKPVQIKTGINDGVSTQVVDGLKEGDEVVVGLNLSGSEGQSGASNPFNTRRF